MELEGTSTETLIYMFILLLCCSAFFSSSETAMMAINKYRLNHLIKQNKSGAKRVGDLLDRTDKLLSLILIGNTLANFIATTLVTIICYRIFGELGIAIAPVAATLIFLIFAEITPKTIAARYPEFIALPASGLLKPLMTIIQPVVFIVNAICNLLLRPWQINTSEPTEDHLTPDELRTVLYYGTKLSKRKQHMLLSILDLEKVSVDDILIPNNEISGIDISNDMDRIIQQILSSQFTRLVVYENHLDQIIGVIHLRDSIKFLKEKEQTKELLCDRLKDPYFIPENTPLYTQLFNFQKEKERLAIVVNEYGEIKGMITLEDILEEIVGEYTSNFMSNSPDFIQNKDGYYYLEGSVLIRDLNRNTNLKLPTNGPKTLNGLILENLELIPEAHVSLKINDCIIEILQIQNNAIKTLKLKPIEPPQ